MALKRRGWVRSQYLLTKAYTLDCWKTDAKWKFSEGVWGQLGHDDDVSLLASSLLRRSFAVLDAQQSLLGNGATEKFLDERWLVQSATLPHQK